MGSADGECGNVLVVDDDPMVTRMVRRVLGSRHRVHECNDPREALASIARGDRYDVILCDVRMPGCSGQQFLAGVRDASAELAERVVFMTGATSIAPGAGFLRAIAPERRLAKPFHMEELRDVIRAFLGASGPWKAGHHLAGP